MLPISIKKAGMSYRGERFENAASLSKANVYRGNFLEILWTIAMFVVLKEHLNKVESKAKQGSGGGGGGGSELGSQLTLISKTTINNILDREEQCLKRYQIV